MSAPVYKLRQIRDCCRSGMAPPPELMLWLGDCLSDAIARRAPSFEQAFGLQNDRGGVPWWLESAIRERNLALRSLAERHFCSVPLGRQAQEIHALAVRYGATAWRFDQRDPDMPPRYRGRPQEWLWRAFKSGANMPISQRQLRNIL